MNKLVRLFLYCGVSKEEYQSVKKDAYKSNFNVWKYLHIFMALTYLAYLVESFTHGGMSIEVMIKLFMVIYSVSIAILFFTNVIKEDSLSGQLIIYLSMIFLLISTFWLGFLEYNMIAIAFIILLVLLPMFMIDKPYFMSIVLVIACAIFVFHSKILNTPDLFRNETLAAVTFSLLGIVINTFYNSLRVKEFLLAKQTTELLDEQKEAVNETKQLNNTLQRISINLVEVLGDVVESRDMDSGSHIQRVKGYTYILANQVMNDLPEYNLSKHDVNLITFASSLHDVGKISIPDAILFKPGKLTTEEFDLMKTHCVKGCDIINKMSNSWTPEYLKAGLDICRSHHEKWDGKGYPDGLKGDEIPISAQIVSIADVYDALTTERPYKKAYSFDDSYNMILNGECGAFSEKLLNCFKKCKKQFEAHAVDPSKLNIGDNRFEVVVDKNGSFVVGLHDETKTLQEKVRLSEENSVIKSLSDDFRYVCYVQTQKNVITRFKADKEFTKILDSYSGELKSYERFDKLLNSIIVAEDYDRFRQETYRETCMQTIIEKGFASVKFRIRLEDGIHYCKMRLTLDPNDPYAVIIGIMNVDKAQKYEEERLSLARRLEESKQEIENQKKLADQLAVINCISLEYDYVCSINANTMEVSVYRAIPWIRDMFKNIEDIVVSSEIRDSTLKGIIYPEDYEIFVNGSKHENVLAGLKNGNGTYCVNYRAYKYGTLVHYQTKYVLDPSDPSRIIIGLHSLDEYYDTEL